MSKVIVKESQDIITDFLKTVIKKIDFKQRPFETIFGAMGPILGWKVFGGKIGILLLLLEYIGFGPGRLGRLIDDELNWRPGQALSLDKLKSASESVMENVKKTVGLKASSMLEDIIEIKGTIDEQDLITVALVDKYFPIKTIKKEALGRGRYFKRFLSALKGGKTLGFGNVLYGLLKLFFGGLVGLGVVGVASGLGKRYLGVGLPEEGFLSSPSQPQSPTKHTSNENLYIVNEKGNVEDTLIYFLNSTIQGFSKAFEQVNKKPLKGSAEMRNRLSVIERLNGKSIWELNKSKSFIIPPLMLIANSLLPEARYEKIEGSTAKSPPVKSAPAKKLEELLQGAK